MTNWLITPIQDRKLKRRSAIQTSYSHLKHAVCPCDLLEHQPTLVLVQGLPVHRTRPALDPGAGWQVGGVSGRIYPTGLLRSDVNCRFGDNTDLTRKLSSGVCSMNCDQPTFSVFCCSNASGSKTCATSCNSFWGIGTWCRHSFASWILVQVCNYTQTMKCIRACLPLRSSQKKNKRHGG